jgi:hypothetical protein
MVGMWEEMKGACVRRSQACAAIKPQAQPALAKTWTAERALSPPAPPVADWVRWALREWPI